MTSEEAQLEEKMEESVVCDFYRDKHILLTGATGFLGKSVLEKLLRVCKPKMVYLLVRHKKCCEPQKRIQELTQSPMFDRLKREVPDFMNYISIVSGDISLSDLNLLPSDRDILIENVNIVLHGAATVKFDEKLDLATKINVLGTKTILELCSKMKNLQSVVYISTAFSNCQETYINEDFYETPLSADNLIKLTECLKEQQLEMVTPFLMDKWPNTYAFTKAVAEDAVRTYGKGLPVAVFRPAIIIAAKSEPVPGWSDNLYGPQGISLGVGVGLIRVIRCDPKCKTNIVPVDFAANCLLAVAYNTSKMESRINIPVYNFCADPNNSITWEDYMKICNKRALEVPTVKAIWYCSCSLVKTQFAFFLLTFLLHIIPALVVDVGLILMNKKPRALNIYKKIHKLQNLLYFFSTNNWYFSVENTLNLWRNLPAIDKTLFNFDMSTLDFNSYLRTYVDGLRIYVVKDSESTIPYGRRRNIMLYVAHRVVQLAFFSSFGWCFWRLFVLTLG